MQLMSNRFGNSIIQIFQKFIQIIIFNKKQGNQLNKQIKFQSKIK